MNLYLHIGTHKTGSSTIQRLLERNRDQLLNKGFYYGEHINNKELSWTFRKNFSLPKRSPWDRIADKQLWACKIQEQFKVKVLNLSPVVHSVILSSEDYWFLESSEIKLFHTFLSQIFSEIKIICYIREQSSYITSLWGYHVKMGSMKNALEEYQNSFLADEKQIAVWNISNYHLALTNWSLVFGKENMHIRIFDKQYLKNSSVSDDFFWILDKNLSQHIETTIEMQNVNLNPLGLVLARAINFTLPMIAKDGYVDESRLQLNSYFEKNFFRNAGKITTDNSKCLYAKYHASNILVNRDFFGDTTGSNCFMYKELPNHESIIEVTKNDFPRLVDLFKILHSNICNKEKQFELRIEEIKRERERERERERLPKSMQYRLDSIKKFYLRFTYLRYRIIAEITFGQRKVHYKAKKRDLKKILDFSNL